MQESKSWVIGIPEQCFEWPKMFEDLVIDVIEVEEVRCNLGYPIRLHHDDSADVYQRHLPAKKRLVLHP